MPLVPGTINIYLGKNLSGKPDIALTQYKIVISCDSEFFHGIWNVMMK